MRSIWLRARLDTAPRFCGLEIGRQRWHSKRRAHTESHSAPTPSERVMGRLAVRLALQAIENRVYLSEPVRRVSVSLFINPPSAGPEAVRRGRNRRYCIGERPREQIKAAQPRGLRCARTIQGRVRRSRSRKVAKGYEYRRGQFVTFTAGELKALDVESSKVIDLETFVPRGRHRSRLFRHSVLPLSRRSDRGASAAGDRCSNGGGR